MKKNNGFNLVELMVSVAIFGILSLGVASLFTQNAKLLVTSSEQASLASDAQEFTNILEDYLGNLTHFVGCGCSNFGTNCVYSANGPDCNSGACNVGNATLVVFEYEDALLPSIAPTTADCLDSVANPPPNAGGSILLRGCKKLVGLVYEPPVAAGGAVVNEIPGKLTLMGLDPVTSVPNRIITQLVGVTNLRCGQNLMPGPAGNITSGDSFHMDISMKAGAVGRNTVAGLPPTGGSILVSKTVGSFNPTGVGFANGLHRNFTIDVGFRNLVVPGVYFGRPYVNQNCTADGQVSFDGNCCSGYRYGAGGAQPGVCIAANNCTLRTLAADEYGECCTHTIDSAGTACQW